LIENLQKMIDSKDFDTIRSDLQIRLRDKKHAMNEGIRIFKSQKQAWDENRLNWKNLRFVHEDFFKNKGYELDKRTGEVIIPKETEGKKDEDEGGATTTK
jgi:hypothetical protein